MTLALSLFGGFLQDSSEFCLHFTLFSMRNYEKLCYQEGIDNAYRTTWYGNPSTQIHFQKLVRSVEDGTLREKWIDVDYRTMMEMPSTVKDLWQEMRDYYNYCLQQEQSNYYNNYIAQTINS